MFKSLRTLAAVDDDDEDALLRFPTLGELS
jgi:hypothetical protein